MTLDATGAHLARAALEAAAYQTFEPFSNQPAEALARRVAGLAPMAGAKVFFTPGGGSDAVDTAAKLARGYWRAVGQGAKQITIARSHAYHGMNAYGTSLGGIPAVLVADQVKGLWNRGAAVQSSELATGPKVKTFTTFFE